MGAEKKSADDEVDDTMDKFWAHYTKACKNMEVPRLKSLEDLHRETYIDGGQMLTKVSYVYDYQIDSSLSSIQLAGKALN